MHWNKTLRVLPFVKTDRPAPSRRNENSTFNQNYPAKSVKYWIVCTKKMVFPQKLLKRPFHFQTDWSSNGAAGKFWQMDWVPLASFWKWEFWNSDIACDFIPLSWKPQQLTYPKTTFFRRYFALNALKENRIQVFRLAFTYGPAVTVTLVTRPVVPVCRHLTAEWLPRLSGAQSPSRLISSGV